jgi:hypothetical protein
VRDPHRDAWGRQPARPSLWPLDEHDGVLEVRLEAGPVGVSDAAGAAHERRLARAELAGDEDDVSDAELRSESDAGLFGLGGSSRRDDQNSPSCSAGAAAASSGSSSGSAGWRDSKSISPGSRAKSSSSTVNMLGV